MERPGGESIGAGLYRVSLIGRPKEESTVNPPAQSSNGAGRARRSLVTIIAPAYNEAENAAGLVGFFREIKAYRPDLDFELIVVDDGSTDGTARLVTEALQDGDVARVVTLSRNFGSHA